MDFLDPQKKRAQRIRLFVGYVLVGIAITIGSLILLFQAYGYDLDRKTGKVIQNGLVFVSARPESATIYIDGQRKDQTDARYTLPAGQYAIELRRDGYHTWKRTFTLDGGSIERLLYPMLFPQKLVTKDLQLYSSTPTFATESPDRRWLLAQQPQSVLAFDVFDLANANAPSATITLPADILTQPGGLQSFSLVEWSTDNRHLLVKHTYIGGEEFIMVDRQTPSASFNVNKTLNTAPSQVALHDKKYDQLYIYMAATRNLQTADIKTKQIAPFLQNVLAFKPYGADVVLYVSDDGSTPGKVQLKLHDNDGNFLMRAMPGSTSYLLDLAQYSGHWYVVGGASVEGRVNIYKDPQSFIKSSPQKLLVPVSVLKIDQAQFVSFSVNTQYVVVQNAHKFGAYDIETDRRYYYELKLPIAVSQEAKWMDGNRLTLINDNKTVVFDFDGTNQQTLSASVAGFLPFFDRDYTALYNIAPSKDVPGRTALTRTDLKVIK